MIQWATARPVAYNFTTSSFHSITFTKAATLYSSIGAEAGSSYTSYSAKINQNGTSDYATVENVFSRTVSISTSSGTSVSSSSLSWITSASSAKSHSVTTTTETTMETVVFDSALETYELGGSAWTTTAFTTLIGGDTTELTAFSTRATSYASVVANEGSSVSVTTETTITNGETALGDVFDLVFKDSNLIFIAHTNAAIDLNSVLSAASALGSTTGTQVTLSHLVGVVPVSFTNTTETSFTTLAAQTLFSEVLNAQYLQNSSITLTENIDPTRLPNSTAQIVAGILTTVNEPLTNEFFAGGGVGLPSMIFEDTAICPSAYTYSNYLKNPAQSPAQTFSEAASRAVSSTFQAFYPHVLPTYSTTFVDGDFSHTIISAGGGNTTAITKTAAVVTYNQAYDESVMYEDGFENGYSTIIPVCAVYKPYGVYVGDELFLGASLTGTTLTGVQVAGLSRGGIYKTAAAYEADFGAPKQPGAANQANRFILTYPDQSNSSFTISGKSVTYTKTTVVAEEQVVTTQTEEILGAGAARTGYIGERRWFGGQPEESATYYESISRGVYVDQSGNTSYFTGGFTSYADETGPLKLWQPVLAVGNWAAAASGVAVRKAFPGSSYCFLP